MGLYKEIETRAENNGYYDSDKWICADHFKDKYAKQFIQENGVVHACDFCDNMTGSKICISVNTLLNKIVTYINSKYTLVDGNKMYMSDKYKQVYSTDIILHMGVTNNWEEKVVEELQNHVINQMYVYLKEDINFYENMGADLWEEYGEMLEKAFSTDSNSYQCLTKINSRVNCEEIENIKIYLEMASKFIEECQLLCTIDCKKPIFRAVNYLKKDDYSIGEKIPASRVGTPPERNKENEPDARMGYGFYGSSDKEVCYKEVTPLPENYYIIGEFHTNKEATLLDLTQEPDFEIYSFFDPDRDNKISMWVVLKEFTSYITKPVKDRKDDKISYRKTAVLAQYIQEKLKIEGIRYYSTQCLSDEKSEGKVCYVLFVNNGHCMDKGENDLDDSLKLIMEPNPQVTMITNDILIIKNKNNTTWANN